MCSPGASQDLTLVTNICYNTHTRFPCPPRRSSAKRGLSCLPGSPPVYPPLGNWVPAWACLFPKFPTFCLGFGVVCSQKSSQIRASLLYASQGGNRKRKGTGALGSSQLEPAAGKVSPPSGNPPYGGSAAPTRAGLPSALSSPVSIHSSQ